MMEVTGRTPRWKSSTALQEINRFLELSGLADQALALFRKPGRVQREVYPQTLGCSINELENIGDKTLGDALDIGRTEHSRRGVLLAGQSERAFFDTSQFCSQASPLQSESVCESEPIIKLSPIVLSQRLQGRPDIYQFSGKSFGKFPAIAFPKLYSRREIGEVVTKFPKSTEERTILVDLGKFILQQRIHLKRGLGAHDIHLAPYRSHGDAPDKKRSSYAYHRTGETKPIGYSDCLGGNNYRNPNGKQDGQRGCEAQQSDRTYAFIAGGSHEATVADGQLFVERPRCWFSQHSEQVSRSYR